MALEKASIDILSGSKAGVQIRVMFNPSEYTIERSNAYKSTSIPGLGGPLIHFINGEADVLSMELFLDDYTDKPADRSTVTQRLDEFANLLKIDNDQHAPPIVRFVWGKLSFKAIIEKLSRKLAMFEPNGRPVRATVNVSFKEYKTLSELVTKPRLQSADKSKRRVIVGLDSLWLLASREYHDAASWRGIANANDLDDPRDIVSGQWVTVPPLEQRDGIRRSI
ncbi:LysM peptidoglycan-binding domain-containing protein [Mesorhizobium sp. M0590]|uniref:CIS tube protein n=1 Tax=Mesorhizobium sp. M0590 TaxID=2956966 RepID=UPI00333AA7B5